MHMPPRMNPKLRKFWNDDIVSLWQEIKCRQCLAPVVPELLLSDFYSGKQVGFYDSAQSFDANIFLVYEPISVDLLLFANLKQKRQNMFQGMMKSI